mmetsp:Transcript_131110/g.419503  ORF Transcript_131110/g.419503 Transcript_131110/m.419503 type:complete len:209 (+) Transcript_131110:883-1509(+)
MSCKGTKPGSRIRKTSLSPCKACRQMAHSRDFRLSVSAHPRQNRCAHEARMARSLGATAAKQIGQVRPSSSAAFNMALRKACSCDLCRNTSFACRTSSKRSKLASRTASDRPAARTPSIAARMMPSASTSWRFPTVPDLAACAPDTCSAMATLLCPACEKPISPSNCAYCSAKTVCNIPMARSAVTLSSICEAAVCKRNLAASAAAFR